MDSLLEFLNRHTNQPFQWDAEAGVFTRIQFSGDWLVRYDLPSGYELGIEYEQQWVALINDVLSGGYRLPSENETHGKKAKELAKKVLRVVGGAAGLLQIEIWNGKADDKPRPLKPGLWTVPASLSEADYRELLDYLKGLAVGGSVKSLVPIAGTSTPGQAAIIASGKAIDHDLAHGLIELMRVVDLVWPLLASAPATDLGYNQQRVRQDQPLAHRSTEAARRATTHPGQLTVPIRVPQVTNDTQENRFLAHLLNDVVIKLGAAQLISLRRQQQTLEHELSRSLALPNNLPRTLSQQYRNRYQAQRKRQQEKVARLHRQTVNLELAMHKAERYLVAPFLRTSLLHAHVPDRPSQKLIQSNGYGPLFQAYTQLGTRDHLHRAMKGVAVYEHLAQLPVRPLAELYEIWLVLEIYRLLTEEFHFQPVNLGPLDYLKVTPVTANLERNYPFRLELRDPANPTEPFICQVDVLYEPKWERPLCAPGKTCFRPVCPTSEMWCYKTEYKRKEDQTLTPDVGLVVRTPQKVFRFALDAKYRDYAKPCVTDDEIKKFQVQSTYEADLLGVAKMKYLNALDLTAAFIIHTDPDPKWEFWGEQPLPMPTHRERVLGHNPGWPAHRVGTVFATPLLPDNLRKLIKCLLMYHAQIYNVCWGCGQRLTVANGGATVGPRAENKEADAKLVEAVEHGSNKDDAVYYMCPKCENEFWVLQRCQGKHHPILKFGLDSFHARSRNWPDNLWLNICPQCGSDLPKDFKKPA